MAKLDTVSLIKRPFLQENFIPVRAFESDIPLSIEDNISYAMTKVKNQYA